MMETKTKKLPVVIVTGFLGSGKTTLLAKVLSTPAMSQTAVIVNEFGEVGLDHHLLRSTDEQTMLIRGGCLCCTFRDDLVIALKELLDMYQRRVIPRFDRVIIETSGLADPAPIIFTILSHPVLQHHYYIDCVIVTVDAVNGHINLNQQPESIKQIAVGDIIVVTKTDIASPEVVSSLVARLRRLNPTAQVIEAIYGNIDLDILLNANTKIRFQKIVDRLDTLELETAANKHFSNIRSISIMYSQLLDWTAFGIWLSMLLHARGKDILRVKGILDVGEKGPVILNGVQHIIHTPEHLADWPSDDHRSHLIFIMRSIHPSEILDSLNAFQQFLGARPTLLDTSISEVN